MRGERVSTLVALCVFSIGADVTVETAAPPPTTPDVDAQWLEGFRRQLLRDDHTYGPEPARAPADGSKAPPAHAAGRPPDTRRDGALPRDGHGDASQAQGAHSSDDAAASRENGISRRDLREPSREASFTDEELDLPRKAFLDNLYELEEQLEPVYVSSKKETGDGNTPIQSRKKNEEDVQESPPYIELNGVRRYKVNMGRKQRIRNQFDDGLTWLQDVITHELSAERNEYENEENEDTQVTQQYENDNEDKNYNQGRPQYEQDESRGQENEQEQEESASRPEEESGENGEQTQELDASEYKQENVRSRYVGGRRDGGGRVGDKLA